MGNSEWPYRKRNFIEVLGSFFPLRGFIPTLAEVLVMRKKYESTRKTSFALVYSEGNCPQEIIDSTSYVLRPYILINFISNLCDRKIEEVVPSVSAAQ